MIRNATVLDVKTIQTMVNAQANQGVMLGRSLGYLYENLRDYSLFIDEETNAVVGCCALHISWESLGEIKSLVVDPTYHKKGVGAKLVANAMEEAKVLGLTKVFALTYVDEFFIKQGFHKIDKSELPHKIWLECVECCKFPDCDEIPVMREIKE